MLNPDELIFAARELTEKFLNNETFGTNMTILDAANTCAAVAQANHIGRIADSIETAVNHLEHFRTMGVDIIAP